MSLLLRSNRWIVGMGLPVLAAVPARGEDQIAFTHESYNENKDRMTVNTESVLVQKTLDSFLDFTFRGVYDGISGATPIGAPAPNQITLHRPNSNIPISPILIRGFTRAVDAVSGASPGQTVSRLNVPLAQSQDIRRGIDVATGMNFGSQRLVPEFSYSKESDYISYAGALNYSLELNEKNTTLNAGWSHSYDQVLATPFTFLRNNAIKNSDDFILGVTQLLTPGTILTLNGSIGHTDGYLSDPYRGVVFDGTVLSPTGQLNVYGEKRPTFRDSQSIFLELTQAVPAMNASVEGSYRYYHDSFGIIANTVSAAWFQKIGPALVVSPSVRYYCQGAAHFYGVQFPGDPTTDPGHIPTYYSSDYRLSFFESVTIGIEATVKIQDQLDLRLGYKRYWMRGLDRSTSQSAYPSADIFTIGLNYTF